MFEYLEFAVYLGMFFLCLLALAQFVIVPWLAHNRGRDGAAWFMITMIWLCFNSVLVVFGAFAMAATMWGAEEHNWTAFAIAVGGFVIVAGLFCLPLWAVILAGDWKPRDDAWQEPEAIRPARRRR